VLVAPRRCEDQADLLRAFDLPIALLQDAEALERSAAELVEDKAAEGVRYVEIRWGPLLHTRGGLGGGDVVAAVLRGSREAARRTGTDVRLIATLLRSHDPEANLAFVVDAERYRGDGLVAIDLAGPEASFPDPLVHVRAFDAARAGGFHITLHAGEWGGAPQVRRALEVNPERIAHGTPAGDDPALLAEIARRGVWLDLCPTSNVQAGIVADLAAHPIARMHRDGVPVTLSTDSRTVSDVSLSEEYVRGVEACGLTVPELRAIDRGAIDAAFAEDDLKARLRAEFDAWATGVPETRVATIPSDAPRQTGFPPPA